MSAIRGGGGLGKCHNFSILGGTFPFVYDSVVKSIFTVKTILPIRLKDFWVQYLVEPD